MGTPTCPTSALRGDDSSRRSDRFFPLGRGALGFIARNSLAFRAPAAAGATIPKPLDPFALLPPLTNYPPSPQAFAAAHAALAAWVQRRLTQLTADPGAAEDLAQRTWMAVWEAVRDGRYDPQRAAMSTYVYAVSQNVFRNWARSRATSASHAAAIAAASAAEATPDADPIEDAEVVDELRGVLRDGAPGLAAGSLRVLQLIAQGLTDRELAKALAVAPSTAHARRREALDALRNHLEKRFSPERSPTQCKQQSGNP